MRGVVLSNSSDKPIYQQLFEQISSQIVKSELTGDVSLPPIRTAAKELRISVITVKKAWEELERQGLMYSVVGRGCFVSRLSIENLSDIKQKLVEKQMNKDIQFYKELGLTSKEMTELIKSHYE